MSVNCFKYDLHIQIDEVLSDRLPSLEDMRKLPYVEAVILEVMRRETMLELGFQRSTLCDTEVDGYFIPKNTVVGDLLLIYN